MHTNATTAAQKDMHPADVLAALKKRGVSLRQLAIKFEYKHIDRVLRTPWLAAEKIVADALGLKPEVIWPERYVKPELRIRAFQLTRKVELTKPRARRTQRKGVAA
ncbi:MAG: helix-turn-helix domain-containing protein [Burkholderiales bacterium]|nr:helix-turn-helix domain-containing protein [Burkholderiales bacterium]